MPYLTEKAAKSPGGKIAGSAACLLFALAAVSVAADDVAQGDWGGMAADLFLLVLSLWPVARTVRHIIRRRRAQALAGAFYQVSGDAVLIDRIERVIPMRDVRSKLRDLLNAKYLQNVFLDWEKGEITLTAPHQLAADHAVMAVDCPHCGAPGRAIRGRVSRCDFCGSILVPDQKKL